MPDEDIKKLLEANLELSKENNRMIRALHRNYKITRVFRLVYISLILISIFGLYYYLEPYVEEVSRLYGGSANTLKDLQEVIENFK